MIMNLKDSLSERKEIFQMMYMTRDIYGIYKELYLENEQINNLSKNE